MRGFDTAVLEYHLRHLDEEDLAALVADLYAARGYGTTREGGLVRATTGGETLRVWVPQAAGTAQPDPPVDAVVTLDGRARDHADARQLRRGGPGRDARLRRRPPGRPDAV